METVKLLQPGYYWDWLRRREPRVLFCVIAIAGLLWIFFEVVDVVVAGHSHAADEAVLRALRNPANAAVPRGPDWLVEAALEWTALGSWPIVTIIVLSSAGYLALIGRIPTALRVLGSVASGALLCIALKNAFDRPRPDIVPALTEGLSASFPSGHALTAAVVYLTLGAMLAAATPRLHVKIYLLSIALFLTGLVGITRIYLGVHYPTDVLAGWCIGAAWALSCWLGGRLLHQRRSARALHHAIPE